MKPVPINGMTLNKELRDKQMTGVGQEGDPMFAVRSSGHQHAVGFYSNQGSLGQGNNEELSPTLKAAESTNHAAVAYNFCGGSKRDFHVRQTEIAACVTTKSQEPGETTQNSITAVNQPQAVAFDTTQITSPSNYSVPKDGAPCHPLAAGAHPPAIAFGGDIARTLQARHDSSPCADRGMDVVASLAIRGRADGRQLETRQDGTANALVTPNGGRDGMGVGAVQAGMAVRRLTPRECERLQGFPDDHTLIPWRGKPAEQCPDGPRYKALGNSMAVPCMAWIGSRIAAQESEPLRYLSVCSGIEAASMAWEPLGWQPAAFAEVEKFPSAVLAHHWPQVPNLGDMTRYESWDLGAIDLLVGGTPCQSFSVAGLRKGLHDPRGGLMLTYLEIARRFGPRWLVWENVPGVLSSHGGRDFGAFLGALGALGYGWAYRVLDAQWFGVAQRRRRVFVVANLGDGAAAAKVLFERESVCRNPAPSREAGERTAANAPTGIKPGCWWDGAEVAATLTKEGASGDQRMPDKGNFGAVLEPISATVTSKWARGSGGPAGSSSECGNLVVGALGCRIGAQRAQNAQAGHYVPEVSGTLDRGLPARGGADGYYDQMIAERQWPKPIADTLTASYGDKMGLEDQHINGGCGLFVQTPIVEAE